MADESAAPESAPEPAAAAAPAPAPTAPPIASSADWRSSLPPELQVEKSLEGFKNVGDLARSWVETKRMVGAPLEPPPPDAKPEHLSAYRKRAGVPEKPDGYAVNFPKPADGSDFAWDPHWVGVLKERAHAAHMTSKQLNAMAELYHEYMHAAKDHWTGKQAAEEQAERERAIKALEERGWGPRDGPQWRHKNGRALAVIRHIFGDAAPHEEQAIYEMAANPYFADGIQRLADGLLEKGFISGAEYPAGVTPAAAQAKIDAMRAAADKDPQHPLNNKMHPDYQRTWNEYMEWQMQVYGPESRRPIPGLMRRGVS